MAEHRVFLRDGIWEEAQKKGLSLGKEPLEYVLGHIYHGMNLAGKYIEVPENFLGEIYYGIDFAKKYPEVSTSKVNLVIESVQKPIGYGIDYNAVFVSFNFLNGFWGLDLGNLEDGKLLDKTKIVGFMPKIGLFPKEPSFSEYLIGAGSEELIHSAQYKSDAQKVKSRININEDEFNTYSNSEVIHSLSDFEVEARQITDEIFRANNMCPLWENFDAYLRNKYPEDYCKPVKHLIEKFGGVN